MTFSDSIKSIFWQSISTLLGKLHDKIEKTLSNGFWENCFQMENGPNLTLLTFKIDLQDDSTKSIFLQYISTFLRKLHAKKEQKLSGHFWEINHLPVSEDKRPVGLIAPPFIISFLATGNWPKIKLDDSAFFRTQSYITEICYFEYLLSFGLQKKTIFLPSSEKYKT